MRCMHVQLTMEEERQRDLRVPVIIFLLFLISCVAGGILLLYWVFEGNGSHPWLPILALVLIACPWIFWLLTYIYTLIKHCFQGGAGGGGGRHPRFAGAGSTDSRHATSSRGSSSMNSSSRKPPLVVRVDGGGASQSSVGSSKECEMPLAQSASS